MILVVMKKVNVPRNVLVSYQILNFFAEYDLLPMYPANESERESIKKLSIIKSSLSQKKKVIIEKDKGKYIVPYDFLFCECMPFNAFTFKANKFMKTNDKPIVKG